MNRIRELRAEREMHQAELAEKLRVTDGTVSKYENEQVALTSDTLCKLAEIFGVSVDYIMGLSDDRRPGTSMSKPHMNWDALALVKNVNSLSPEGRHCVLALVQSPGAQEAAIKYAALSSRSKKKALDYMEMLKVMEDVRPLREDI